MLSLNSWAGFRYIVCLEKHEQHKQTGLTSLVKPWLITVNCYLACKVQNISLLFPQNRKLTLISHFSRNYLRCHCRMTRHS